MSAVAKADQGAKLTVHWLNESRGQRIVWLLEELNLDYDIKIYFRQEDKHSPPELKQVTPLGKSPAITIEAPSLEKPLVLAESGAIVEYIADHFGTHLIPKRYPDGSDGLVGAETKEWLRHRFLMHYAEGSLMPVLFTGLLTHNIRKAPVPFFLKFITRKIADMVDGNFTTPELKLNLTYLETFLSESPENEFLCGPNLTVADFMMIFALEAAVLFRALNETSYPKLYSYVRRIQNRDAYKRAGEKVSEVSGVKYVPFSESKL
ncbi:glutathione transferase [Bimuria novae-zelandiae CBS 107.79]|uniref:Glutathione transferase n=1 Tax=Bimuria novae-zelandiae CBS 107.79 TaxID=1447943 RepID=A0A6A5VU29_9PLEO|nr:glutathione transferase [Bimuria novae-zelandiae CBS 107.79]